MLGDKFLQKGASKAVLIAGTSVSAIFMAAFPATAQEAAGNAPEQIIVTAQRRSERLQDVPLAMSIATSAQLESKAITNVRELGRTAPGLYVASSGPNIQPVIRGVYSSQTAPGNDANVSIYIDGVYQPSQVANGMDLPDVNRIEVLKGPQGTLFGRNATGGAIRIFTQEPSLSAFTGNLNLGYGKYNEFVGKGVLSGPIVEDKLGASISVGYEREDGYSHDVIRNKTSDSTDDISVRTKLLAQLNDALSVEWFGSYLHHHDGDVTAYTTLNGNSVTRTQPGAIIPSAPFTYTSELPPSVKFNQYSTGANVNLETGIGKFTSTTAYSAVKSFYSSDADYSSLNLGFYPIYERQSTFQQELVFASKKFGKFSVTAGGTYYGDTSRYDPLILEGPLVAGAAGVRYGYMRQRTDAYAGFGELTFDVTDRLALIGGIRYTSEKRAASGGFFLTSGRPATLPAIGQPTTFNNATPRASARYRLTDDGDNVYFTYSQGFKSGGFNLAALQAVPFKPEKLISYEVGIKTAPSRMISANIAAFYYDYTNQQVQVVINGVASTTNAAASRIYGTDADITARFSQEFTITAGFSVLDAKYRNFANAPVNVPILLPNSTTPCECGNRSTLMDLSNGQEPYAPKFSGSLTADYKRDLAVGLIDLSASVYYTGAFNFEPLPRITQQPYATLALRGTYQPSNSHFSFYVWGKNVTSTRYKANIFLATLGDGVRYVRPAEFGGGVKYDW